MDRVRFMKYAFAVSAAALIIIIILIIPGRGKQVQKAYWDDDWNNVERLLKKGVDPDDEAYRNTLQDVILYEDEEVFRIFAENGEGVFDLENLLLAAEHGRTHVVKAFLDRDFDINKKGEKGISAIFNASSKSEKGNAVTVRLLVKNGADVNVITDYGVNPLMAAEVEYKYARQPGYYNDTEAHIRAVETIMGLVQRDVDRSLLDAAAEGDVSKIKAAFEKGAFINTRNKYGYTPLHIAASKNRVAAVRLLLKKGAETDPLQVNKISPLHLAVKMSGNIQVCEALIKAGAKLNTCDKGFSTLLTDTLLKEKHALLQYLMGQGADPDFSGEYGLTPLMSAALVNDMEALDILLKAHASPDKRDPSGRTAIFFAAESSSLDALKYLIAYGADINSVIEDEKGTDHRSTLLMHAARWGGGPYEKKSALLRWLVEEGADVNRSNGRGKTALIQSAARGDDKMVSLLLELGADKTLKDNEGMTAMDHAEEAGHKETTALLEER